MGQLFPATVLLLSHLLTMCTTFATWDLEKLQNIRSEPVNSVHYFFFFKYRAHQCHLGAQEIQDLFTECTIFAIWEKLQNTRNTRSELVNRVHYIYHFGPGETQEIQDLDLLALVKEEIIWAAQLISGVETVRIEVAALSFAEAAFPIGTLLFVPFK